jgi:hypothetical protein
MQRDLTLSLFKKRLNEFPGKSEGKSAIQRGFKKLWIRSKNNILGNDINIEIHNIARR